MRPDISTTKHALKKIRAIAPTATREEALIYLWLADRLALMRHGIGITRNDYMLCPKFIPTPMQALLMVAGEGWAMLLQGNHDPDALSENATLALEQIVAAYSVVKPEALATMATRFYESSSHNPFERIQYLSFFTPAPHCLPLFQEINSEDIEASKCYFQAF